MLLYHYTKFENALRIVESNQIKFSSPTNIYHNDPFEFYFKDCDKEESFREHFLKKTGLFCCSKKKNNFLMLSHYADSHKGCMIEFEYSGVNFPLHDDVEDRIHFSDLTLPKSEYGELGYSDIPPDISDFIKKMNESAKRWQKKHGSLDGYEWDGDIEDLKKAFYSILGSKLKDWQYEEEVRFILSWVETKSNSYEREIEKKCELVNIDKFGLKIKKIYYGCKADLVDIEKIIKIATQKNIEVEKAIDVWKYNRTTP